MVTIERNEAGSSTVKTRCRTHLEHVLWLQSGSSPPQRMAAAGEMKRHSICAPASAGSEQARGTPTRDLNPGMDEPPSTVYPSARLSVGLLYWEDEGRFNRAVIARLKLRTNQHSPTPARMLRYRPRSRSTAHGDREQSSAPAPLWP